MPDTQRNRRQAPKKRTPERDRLAEDDGLLVFTGPVHPPEDYGDFITRDREERDRVVAGDLDR